MPSVPPTYISLDRSSDAISGLPIVDVLPDRQHTPNSPTPDPDLADGILVVDDSVGAITNVRVFSLLHEVIMPNYALRQAA